MLRSSVSAEVITRVICCTITHVAKKANECAFKCGYDPVTFPPIMANECTGEAFYSESEGKKYCVLHFPGEKDDEQFEAALRRKIDAKDFDFGGVWFHYCGLEFFYSVAFTEAVSFNARLEEHSNFVLAQFLEDVDFSGATLKDTGFNETRFQGNAFFGHANFVGVPVFLARQVRRSGRLPQDPIRRRGVQRRRIRGTGGLYRYAIRHLREL